MTTMCITGKASFPCTELFWCHLEQCQMTRPRDPPNHSTSCKCANSPNCPVTRLTKNVKWFKTSHSPATMNYRESGKGFTKHYLGRTGREEQYFTMSMSFHRLLSASSGKVAIKAFHIRRLSLILRTKSSFGTHGGIPCERSSPLHEMAEYSHTTCAHPVISRLRIIHNTM